MGFKKDKWASCMRKRHDRGYKSQEMDKLWWPQILTPPRVVSRLFSHYVIAAMLTKTKDISSASLVHPRAFVHCILLTWVSEDWLQPTVPIADSGCLPPVKLISTVVIISFIAFGHTPKNYRCFKHHFVHESYKNLMLSIQVIFIQSPQSSLWSMIIWKFDPADTKVSILRSSMCTDQNSPSFSNTIPSFSLSLALSLFHSSDLKVKQSKAS